MKKITIIIAIIVLFTSLFASTIQFKEQVSQECGEPREKIERVNWFWQWWLNRDDNRGFIACVGPSTYIIYRPLDLSGLGLVISTGLFLALIKKR